MMRRSLRTFARPGWHPFAAAILASLLNQPGTDLRASQATVGGAGGVVFTDVTAAAGIRFKHNNGAFGKKYLPETLGSGSAFLDFDNDGWQDILLVNSKGFAGRSNAPSYPAL